jgi:hypothetical protein
VTRTDPRFHAGNDLQWGQTSCDRLLTLRIKKDFPTSLAISFRSTIAGRSVTAALCYGSAEGHPHPAK